MKKILTTIVLNVISIITFLRFRLFMQKRRRVSEDEIATTEIAALNKKYRLVLRANHTIVWTWNLETKEIECECECYLEQKDTCKRYTVTEESFYARIHPDDLVKIKKTYERLANHEITMFQEEFRYRLLTALDEYNWVESFAIVGESEFDGQTLTIVGGMVVITERKRLEQEAQKKEQAEESNRMKSAFLSNIRHEIRTPLNAIVGFSSLITQGVEPEEAAEYRGIIHQNNALLLQLVDDVLDLSDIESGQINFSYSPVDISEMLLMLEKNYREETKKGVKLFCELPQQSYFVNIDGHRVAQVLKNYLSNACKFTSSGYISMGFEETQEGVYFYVTDTGKGIAKENVSQVFDRFAKFDAYTRGVGLGLSVCQTIVHKMKGDVGVYSEEGKGSTFWFTVPCGARMGYEMWKLYEDEIIESEVVFAS